MRRTLLVGATTFALALTACGSGKGAVPQAGLQMAADKYAIGQIEVDWHKASSTKNVDLMMSLWAPDATFTVGGQTYTGQDQIRQFFADVAGPFKPENHWVSETPAYKLRVTVSGNTGTLYFECVYVDVATRVVKAVVSADQDVARINGRWLITNSVAATPDLSP